VDVISDLGTYALAVLAMHHGLRFMVVAPSSAFDVGLEDADEIEPEDALLQRDGRLQLDVTPAELIDVLVTERGVVERPDAGRIAELLSPLRLHREDRRATVMSRTGLSGGSRRGMGCGIICPFDPDPTGPRSALCTHGRPSGGRQ